MLRIIGWMILILIALILGIIGIILLVPVRYNGSAEFPGELKNTTVYLKASWLLHLISFSFKYENEVCDWQLRIAWKKFHESEEELDLPEMSSEIPEKVEKSIEPTVSEEPSVGKAASNQESSPQPEPVKVEAKKKEKKKEVSKREKAVEKIKYTFNRIRDKIKKITDLKEEIQRFLNDEIHRKAYSCFKKNLIWLKRLLKPKVFQMKLHYGFDDPYHTGLLTAFLGMIYPFIGDQVDIWPDFETQIIEGNAIVRGKIRIIHGVIFGLKMIIDASVRKTFSDIMNRMKA